MEYRNWTIEIETDPWAKLFGSKVKFFLEGSKVYSADSIEEAKETIDDIENGYYTLFV